MKQVHGPAGRTELSEEAYESWRRMLQIGSPLQPRSVGAPSCVLEEIVDSGHDVLHELVGAGLIQLAVWEPVDPHPESRTN